MSNIQPKIKRYTYIHTHMHRHKGMGKAGIKHWIHCQEIKH